MNPPTAAPAHSPLTGTSPIAALLTPVQLGDLALPTRVVMAPLTRCRADEQGRPTALTATYYAQRAHPPTGAGMIVSEGCVISPMARGYLDTPGIYTAEQVQAWRAVTSAVHAQGARMVMQLWHVGRVSHKSLMPGGVAPVSSTATPSEGRCFVSSGFAKPSLPRAMRDEEIQAVVQDFAHAAARAMDAGFDGVELHGANGYLIDQFLRDSINDRQDTWGGSISNRCRLLWEATRACANAIGAGRVGVRLSPTAAFGGCALDSNVQQLYTHAVAGLSGQGLAYLHWVEGTPGSEREADQSQQAEPFALHRLRPLFDGGWIVNNSYTAGMAQDAINNRYADAVAFGRPFIANPDLTYRLQHALALNKLNAATLYGANGDPHHPGDAAKGYTDYPCHAQPAA